MCQTNQSILKILMRVLSETLIHVRQELTDIKKIDESAELYDQRSS